MRSDSWDTVLLSMSGFLLFAMANFIGCQRGVDTSTDTEKAVEHWLAAAPKPTYFCAEGQTSEDEQRQLWNHLSAPWARWNREGRSIPDAEIRLLSLFDGTQDEDRQVLILKGLNAVGGVKSVPKLVQLLRSGSKDPLVRQTAICALTTIHAPQAIDPLGEALKDASPDIRSTACSALGYFPGDRSVAYLEPMVHDNVVYVREAAERSLKRIRAENK